MNHVDENDALYQRIRSGDTAAVAEMIERNMPLVKSRVTLFLTDYRRFRHLRDDLTGEGFLALTEAVNSFAGKDIGKPTGYIVSAIDCSLSKYVDSETGSGLMSGRTVQRRRSRKQPLPQQLPIDVAEPPAHLWRNASGRIERKQIDSDSDYDSFGRPSKTSHTDAEQFINRFENDDATGSDLLDSILACCECEEDETIVRLRIKGYNDEEIGEQIGLSRQTVNRRRKEIEERFERMKKPGQ